MNVNPCFLKSSFSNLVQDCVRFNQSSCKLLCLYDRYDRFAYLFSIYSCSEVMVVFLKLIPPCVFLFSVQYYRVPLFRSLEICLHKAAMFVSSFAGPWLIVFKEFSLNNRTFSHYMVVSLYVCYLMMMMMMMLV